jgi:CDP-diacylglycerol--serine O-phosphatidyltransferase
MKVIPLSKLMPSLVTLLGLCLGISSVRYAFDDKFTISAALIFLAALLDGLDGRLARLLNTSSEFGAHLDSLSDMVNFGVAPAIVTYLWSLHGIPVKGVGWGMVLFFIMCSVIRLARFNTGLSVEEEIAKSGTYFTGVPMPAAAALALMPMITSFDYLPDFDFNPYMVGAYLMAVGILMVSTIPTFSFKKVAVRNEFVPIIMLTAVVVFTTLVFEPWLVLPVAAAIYVALIPLSVLHYMRSTKNA